VNDAGGTAVAGDWTMHVDGAAHSFAGAESPGVARVLTAGAHVVSESGGPGGYSASFSGDCDSSGRVVLQAGGEATCTITNDDVAPTLRVIKRVVNNDGGVAKEGDWTMHVKAGLPLADVAGSPFPGAASPGVLRTLRAGTYVVSESGGPGGYAASFSGDCNGGGQVTLAVGQNKTCTVTNDDVAVAPPPPPPGDTCDGKAATLVGDDARNVIRGTPKADVIVAGGGNDRIVSGSGRDLICAGAGNDRALAGPGTDRVFGEGGRDVLAGQAGVDRMDGGAGDDTLAGKGARDRLAGGAGDDRLTGATGNDSIFGEEGDDKLLGGRGADRLDGGPGRDTCVGGPGADRDSGCE